MPENYIEREDWDSLTDAVRSMYKKTEAEPAQLEEQAEQLDEVTSVQNYIRYIEKALKSYVSRDISTCTIENTRYGPMVSCKMKVPKDMNMWFKSMEVHANIDTEYGKGIVIFNISLKWENVRGGGNGTTNHEAAIVVTEDGKSKYFDSGDQAVTYLAKLND